MDGPGSDAEPVGLGDAALDRLPEGVARPGYDRRRLNGGIVHIGLGNFHRAHQAWYLHRLMQEGRALDWAILGAGVRPYDARMRGKLLAQDCLTTLVELDPGAVTAEVIGPMRDYIPVETGNGALVRSMADPAVRIVSLTITEGGYHIDLATGGFDAAHPDIRHDAASPGTPRTAFGAIVAALKLRRDAGLGPFTLMSCDNLQENGEILRRVVTSLARRSDGRLGDWIDRNVAFPNSMVDCIVPATGPEEIARVRALGVDDRAPVMHENFRQWVIEDRFCAGRPEWDRVGVTFTDDVRAWELMKIRILNAGHQVLANSGEILAIPTIADCMGDPLLAAFFRKVQTEEIVPRVPAVPGMTPTDYLDLIDRRFSNPAVGDTTRRVACDGSARHAGFVLPILREALAAGGRIRGLALVEALWARMCAGVREDGSAIEPNDPFWDDLAACAAEAREDPRAWLRQSRYYGDLAEVEAVAEEFCRWLNLIWSDGCREALRAYVSD